MNTLIKHESSEWSPTNIANLIFESWLSHLAIHFQDRVSSNVIADSSTNHRELFIGVYILYLACRCHPAIAFKFVFCKWRRLSQYDPSRKHDFEELSSFNLSVCMLTRHRVPTRPLAIISSLMIVQTHDIWRIIRPLPRNMTRKSRNLPWRPRVGRPKVRTGCITCK